MKTCPVCDTGYPDHHDLCPTDGAVLIVSLELEAGRLVRGKYRIVSKLGQGGMGVVYLAEHILLGGLVALKFLAGDLGKDPKFIKRFRNEARAAYQLRHPNIVEVTDLDQAEDGSLFIAMAYIDGPSLAGYARTPEGTLIAQPVERSIGIARQIASGLGAAHAMGMVHRDIKPENIQLAHTAEGGDQAKILDFGIVAMADDATRVSRTRGLLLTPAYAAPEQWIEMPAEQMDGRTDLYALGGVLYEMLTGQTPFHAQTAAGWMHEHEKTPPRAPSALRPELAEWEGLDALVLQLLAKSRDERPKDAAEVIRLIDGVHRVGVEARKPTLVEDTAKRRETIRETPGPEPKPEPKPRETLAADSPRASWSGLRILLTAGSIAVGLAIAVAAYAWFSGATLANLASRLSSHGDPNLSESLYIRACRVGDAGACGVIAKLAESHFDHNDAQGQTSPEDLAQGSKLARIACEGGSADACSVMGIATLGSEHVSAQTMAESVAWLQKSCDGGSGMGCRLLGIVYDPKLGLVYGGEPGITQDTSKAKAFYLKALALDIPRCDADDHDGCEELEQIYFVGAAYGIQRDPAKVAEIESAYCEENKMRACYGLGQAYEHGTGVSEDLGRAATLFAKACDTGTLPDACGDLGDMYLGGNGVTKDPAKGKELYQKGCDVTNTQQQEHYVMSDNRCALLKTM